MHCWPTQRHATGSGWRRPIKKIIISVCEPWSVSFASFAVQGSVTHTNCLCLCISRPGHPCWGDWQDASQVWTWGRKWSDWGEGEERSLRALMRSLWEGWGKVFLERHWTGWGMNMRFGGCQTQRHCILAETLSNWVKLSESHFFPSVKWELQSYLSPMRLNPNTGHDT